MKELNLSSEQTVLAVLLVIIIIAVPCYRFLSYSIDSVFYPTEIDPGEGITLNEAYMIKGNMPIYKDIDSYPYIQVCYPPLYLWFLSIIMPENTLTYYAIGRVMALISSIGVALLIYLILKHYTKSYLISIVGIGIYVSSLLIIQWSSLARIDFPGIFMMMLGLFMYIKNLENKNTIARFYVIPLICGILIKHTLIAVPLSIISASILSKDEENIRTVLFGFIITAITFLTINFFTDNGFFNHIFIFSSSFWDINLILRKFFIINILMALPFITIWFADKSRFYKKYSLLTFLVIFSLIETFAMAREGCNTNFRLEFSIAMTIIISILLFEFLNARHLFGAVMLYILILLSWFFPNGEPRKLAEWKNYHALQKRVDNINRIIKKSEGPVLTHYACWALFNDKDFLFDSFGMSSMSWAKLWDEKPVIDDIKNSKFSLIILQKSVDTPQYEPGYRTWTGQILRTIRDSYKLYKEDIGTYIYIPKKAQQKQDKDSRQNKGYITGKRPPKIR
ncbi:hypothetical protein M0R36_02290 [bacterium]|jgi:hypothetical protein|nr:hypothetical protein [bacterium]